MVWPGIAVSCKVHRQIYQSARSVTLAKGAGGLALGGLPARTAEVPVLLLGLWRNFGFHCQVQTLTAQSTFLPFYICCLMKRTCEQILLWQNTNRVKTEMDALDLFNLLLFIVSWYSVFGLTAPV